MNNTPKPGLLANVMPGVIMIAVGVGAYLGSSELKPLHISLPVVGLIFILFGVFKTLKQSKS